MNKVGSLNKNNKTDQLLARLTKKKNPELTKIRNEGRDITTDLTEIKRIVREYHEQLHANKLDHLHEMDKFLEIHKLPKWTKE